MQDATHFIEFYENINTGKFMRSPEPQKISKLKANLKMTADSPSLKTIFVMKIKPKAGYENLCEPVLISGDTINDQPVLIVEPIK